MLYRSNAPAPRLPGTPDSEHEESILGLVPHQLRGSLARFNNVLVTGAAYERCTACSEIVSASFPFRIRNFPILVRQVIREYERQGFKMLIEAFNDTKYLERLTGLDKMKEETDAVLDDIEWASEEDD